MNLSGHDCEPTRQLSACPDVMTVGQVAAVLQLSRNTIRAMLVRQEMHGKKIGQQWQIKKHDLLDFLGKPQVNDANENIAS